jgi:hypothetical protein
LRGYETAHVNAAANAKAAKVFVKATASVVACTADCEKCEAFVDSFGYIEKHVFLSSLASVGFDVRLLPVPNAHTAKFTASRLKITILFALMRTMSHWSGH